MKQTVIEEKVEVSVDQYVKHYGCEPRGFMKWYWLMTLGSVTKVLTGVGYFHACKKAAVNWTINNFPGATLSLIPIVSVYDSGG